VIRLGSQVEVEGKKGRVVTIYTDGRDKDLGVELDDGPEVAVSRDEVER